MADPCWLDRNPFPSFDRANQLDTERLAHDIRNPVGLIVGCISLLLNDTHEPDPDLVKTFHRRSWTTRAYCNP